LKRWSTLSRAGRLLRVCPAHLHAKVMLPDCLEAAHCDSMWLY
jgi:hypothetical protein